MRRVLAATALAWTALVAAATTGPIPTGGARPPGPAALLLWPVKPYVLAWRWARAQDASEAGRPEEALEALRLVEALDPTDVAATQFRAHLTGRDLAAAAADPDERFARISEALDLLARSEAATDAPEIALARGGFLLEGWTADPAMVSRFVRRYGGGTLAAAVADLGRAVARAPGSVAARTLFAEASRLRGIERIVREGDWRRGVEDLEAAAAAPRSAEERATAAATVAAAWATWAKSARDGAAEEVRSATRTFLATLRGVVAAGGSGAEEIYLAASILNPLIELGLARAREGEPRRVLSVAEAADSIRRFAEAEAQAHGLAPARENLSRAAVVRLLEGVKTADGSLARAADQLAADLLRPRDR